MEFTDFPPCKHRFGCLECRNNPKFHEHMKKRFGEWQCPEGIAVGTPLEKMPQHIQDKIKSYQQKKSSLPVENREMPGNPVYEQKGEGKKFSDTPQCKKRIACFQCRNDERFRKMIEQRMGEIECPLGIEIGTPLEKLPQEAQEAHKKMEEQRELQKKRMENAKEAFNMLEQVVPPSSMHLLDRIKFMMFPNEKKPDICIHAGEATKVNEKCCGGKVKEVDGVVCKLKGSAVGPKTCQRCDDYQREHK